MKMGEGFFQGEYDGKEAMFEAVYAFVESDDSPKWLYMVLIRWPDTEESEDDFHVSHILLFGQDGPLPPLMPDTMARGLELVSEAMALSDADGALDWRPAQCQMSDLSHVAEHGPLPMMYVPAQAAREIAALGTGGEVSFTDPDQGVPDAWVQAYGSGNGQGGYL